MTVAVRPSPVLPRSPCLQTSRTTPPPSPSSTHSPPSHPHVNDLVRQYDKDVIIVEYSSFKREVNDISSAAGPHSKGTCIWEPLNTWEQIFNPDGNANDLLYLYDDISRSLSTPAKPTPAPSRAPTRTTPPTRRRG